MIFSTSGSKFYIGGVKADKSTDFLAADFDGATWVEIKGLDSLGSTGDSSEEVAQAIIGEGRVKRLKGPRTGATMEVIAAIDYADAGQQAMIAAEKDDNNAYAFRLVFNDAPAGGTPSERMFIAKVGSLTEVYDQAASVMKLNASLWIDSNVVRINAAA